MKKPTFYFLVSLITFGFAGGITPAHAASTPQQQGADTHAQSTMVLKQGLDILGNLLTQLESIVSKSNQSNQPIANQAEIYAALGALQINLIGVQTALANYSPAIASVPPAKAATPAPIITASPYGSAYSPLAAPDKTENTASPNAASVGLSIDNKNLLWPAITLVAVLVLIFFLRMREKKESSETVIASTQDDEPQTYGEETPIIY